MTRYSQSNLDARCFVGGPATGKSTALANRAHFLAASTGQSVVVVCAAPMGCTHMRELLHGGGCARRSEYSETSAIQVPSHEERGDVQVLTVRDVALEIMSDSAVVGRFGRGPRVLDSTEMSVFFEDMKSCGLKRRRLRELLAFLYRGWSDLSDENSDWIKTTEEEACIALARQNLKFIGGVLEAELANLAVKALREDADLLSRHARDHVLVDDYCLMSRASQTLMNLLSRRSVSVATDDVAGLPVGEPYPYAEGLADFLDANPGAVVERLVHCYRPAGVVGVLNNLRADDALGGLALKVGVDDGSSAVEICMESNLVEECRALCELVCRTDADNILIVGTHAVWRANVKRALESCGVSVGSLGADAGCGVARRSIDFCDKGRNSAAMARAIERLVRDEDDSVAWRTWCAFGDALARSASFACLSRAARPLGLSFAEALRRLAADGFNEVHPDDPLLAGLVQAYHEGLAAVEEYKQGVFLQDSGIAEVANMQETQKNVLVGAPCDVFGHTADIVVFGGFVNGFIPSRDYCDSGVIVGSARMRAHRADVQSVYRCVGLARKRLVFTGFTSCGLETAERLKLHIARIRLRDGVRMCAIEPSELLSFVE